MSDKHLPDGTVPVGVAELRDDLRTWLERVGFGGDEVVVMRAGKPIAALVSIDALRALHRVAAAREDVADIEAAREARKVGEYIPLSEALRDVDGGA